MFKVFLLVNVNVESITKPNVNERNLPYRYPNCCLFDEMTLHYVYFKIVNCTQSSKTDVHMFMKSKDLINMVEDKIHESLKLHYVINILDLHSDLLRRLRTFL